MAGTRLANRKRRFHLPMPPPKMGRPTKYKPEYCQIVEELGRQGKSPAQIASVLNVDKASLIRWTGDHEDFRLSLARAKTYEQAYWERLGEKALNRKHFQSQVWRMSMAARFRDEYTEGKNTVEVNLNLSDLVQQSIQPAKAIEPVEVSLSPLPKR